MILQNVENVTYRIGGVSKEEIKAKIKATTEKEAKARAAAMPPAEVNAAFIAAQQLASLRDLLRLTKQVSMIPAISPGFVITL